MRALCPHACMHATSSRGRDALRPVSSTRMGCPVTASSIIFRAPPACKRRMTTDAGGSAALHRPHAFSPAAAGTAAAPAAAAAVAFLRACGLAGARQRSTCTAGGGGGAGRGSASAFHGAWPRTCRARRRGARPAMMARMRASSAASALGNPPAAPPASAPPAPPRSIASAASCTASACRRVTGSSKNAGLKPTSGADSSVCSDASSANRASLPPGCFSR
jgi:hypothetical protein